MNEKFEGLEAELGEPFVAIETEYILEERHISELLKKGWQQVQERVEALRELEAVKDEMKLRWRELDELRQSME